MKGVSDADGKLAVRTARTIAEAETRRETVEPSLPESFDDSSGVFVTINEHPSGNLRGCIGYVEPVMPLAQALAASARSACHDPRFPPLGTDEAKNAVFEVTILSVPSPLEYSSAEDLISKIEIGRDGLMMRCDTFGRPAGAVFLPQVPVEQGWDVREYLGNLCLKAGLPYDTWENGKASFRTFRGTVFAEESPRGPVSRRQ